MEVYTPNGLEIVRIKPIKEMPELGHMDHTFRQVNANLTEYENYFAGVTKSCLLDIHVLKTTKSNQIAVTFRESSQSQGFCLAKGDSIQINMHRQTSADFEKYLMQVWLFNVAFTAFILVALKQSMKEKERTYDSLADRQNFGQQNTYGKNISVVTATANVIWIYLFFAVIFEMASLIKAYFYIFVLPMGALGIMICF